MAKAAHMILRLGLILTWLFLAPNVQAEGGYALGKVFLSSGGHAIAENEQRVIFEQVVDSDCETAVLDTEQSSRIVAGRRGEAVTLGVKLLGCRRAERPDVRCSWSIDAAKTDDASCRRTDGRASGHSSWQGFEGDIALSLPESTGAYELTLECRLGVGDDSATEVVKRDLFVTWAAPLVPFTPTKSEWLARAGCWAAGLGSPHGENDVLVAIRKGLYRYGNDHWRYGYAEKVGDDIYRFLLAETDAGKETVEYQLKDDLGDLCNGDKYCKCPWQTLVDSNALCKFADCYIFSHVFHSMAGVMGVGGLRPVMIQGQGNRGFVTKPLPSLDPKFAGSVRCDEGESCDYYFFGNHSLRLRDGVFHDATFGKAYADADEPIAWSRTIQATGVDEDSRHFADSSKSWEVEGRGYGGWYFLRAGEPEPAPESEEEPGISPPLRFTGNAVIEGSDPDQDELFESLVATVELEVFRAGEYFVEAILRRGEIEVARRPAWDSSRLSGSLLTGGAGKYRVRLAFSGEQIYRSGMDGPYALEAAVEVDGARVVFAHETSEFDHEDFGEWPGNLLSVEARPGDLGDDGKIGELLIKLAAETRESGDFGIEIRVAKDGKTLAYGGLKEDLFTGLHHFEFELGVEENELRSSDLPVEVTAVLYDSKLRAISALVESVD